MSGAASAGAGGTATGFYVYGVVERGAPVDVFAGVAGVDASRPVQLIDNDTVSAIASEVALAEFGAEAVEANLHDPAWLEEKARAHDRVLAAGVGRTSVVPFRFGAIYASTDHVRTMLADRQGLARTLERVRDSVELGVKGFLSTAAVRERLDFPRRLLLNRDDRHFHPKLPRRF